LFHAPNVLFDIAHFEAEVVHTGLHAGVAWQYRQADDPIADMAAIGFPGLVGVLVIRFIPKTDW
jgi:hypothetical protein